MQGRVLIVAGSDSGGGAGIQADIKAVTALGGFAMTAITALTAQNTQGVFAIHDVPAEFLARQMDVVLTDIGADMVNLKPVPPGYFDTLAWQRSHHLVVAGHDKLVGILVVGETGHWIRHVIRPSGRFCTAVSVAGGVAVVLSENMGHTKLTNVR